MRIGLENLERSFEMWGEALMQAAGLEIGYIKEHLVLRAVDKGVSIVLVSLRFVAVLCLLRECDNLVLDSFKMLC